MIEDCYCVIGDNITTMRQRRRMTQAELADRVGLTRTSIVNIELGNQRVMLHTVEVFARALRCKPERILRGCFE